MAGFVPSFAPQSITRQGSRLIIPAPARGQAAMLPPLCVKCGAPANGKPVMKTFYWHHPALYLIILAGVLIYVIVAMIVRKSMKVSVPVCAHHAQRRSTAVMLAWVLPLIGLVDVFVLPSFNVDGGLVALITMVLIFTGIIIWAVVGLPIRPKRIDQYSGEFSGFCEAFLQQFPEPVQHVVGVPAQVPPPPPLHS
jgi:hypothetical protein